MRSSQVVLDRVDVAFDDERAVVNAGLLPATLVERLGSSRAPTSLSILVAAQGGAAWSQDLDPWSTAWLPVGLYR